jgi:hypothetical protein
LRYTYLFSQLMICAVCVSCAPLGFFLVVIYGSRNCGVQGYVCPTHTGSSADTELLLKNRYVSSAHWTIQNVIHLYLLLGAKPETVVLGKIRSPRLECMSVLLRPFRLWTFYSPKYTTKTFYVPFMVQNLWCFARRTSLMASCHATLQPHLSNHGRVSNKSKISSLMFCTDGPRGGNAPIPAPPPFPQPPAPPQRLPDGKAPNLLTDVLHEEYPLWQSAIAFPTTTFPIVAGRKVNQKTQNQGFS